MGRISLVLQSQKAVAAYLKSKRRLLFGFAPHFNTSHLTPENQPICLIDVFKYDAGPTSSQHWVNFSCSL